MRRKENSSLRVILVMTLAMLVFAGIITLIGRLTDRSAAAEIEYEPERRQLKSEEIAADPVSGLSGLMFSSENVMRTDGAYFRLTEDDETGILYAYVPAEMNEQLCVFLNSKQTLRIEGDDVSGTFGSGDTLPAFAENAQYTFTVGNQDSGEEESGTVVFLYTENVPSMYIDTVSGSMESVDSDKKHETSEAASYRIYLTDGEQDSSGMCEIKGRGNSTWSLAKKPYNLNLNAYNSLLGMSSSTKLALIANFWESTQTRQYYAFEAAQRLGLEYTPEQRFVNVYLNGRYHSLCLLTQRINVNGGTVRITDLDKKNKRINQGGSQPDSIVMDTDEDGHEALAYAWEKEPEDVSGGYLIEFDNRYDSEDVWFATGTKHMVFKSPDTPSVREYQYISEYVREAETALFAGAVTDENGDSYDGPEAASDGGGSLVKWDGEKGVNPDTGKSVWDYFDMDSWARMFVIQDFFVQSDDEFYSFYFYKKEGNPLLYCGPVWDFDLCMGNMNCGDYYLTSEQTLWLRDGRKRWLHRMDQFPEFRERVAQIYLEEMEPIVRDILENEFDRNVEMLEKDTRINYLRWGKNLDYDERTGLFRTLFENRVEFVHDYYSDPDSYCRLLFHFAWGDFSYYVKKGESMGFLPTQEYGEKQSTAQSKANGLIVGWRDTGTGGLLQADTPVYEDRDFDPVYQ